MDRKQNIKLGKRRAVAPVIATLLMVAIAVVGGMLVFVFAQDFFTATDNLSGPTIELLQIYGYDFRDRLTGAAIENHNGSVCVVAGKTGGTLENDDVVALYVRNLGANDIIIADVSINGNKLDALTTAAILTTSNPTGNSWGVLTKVTDEVCEDEKSGFWSFNRSWIRCYYHNGVWCSW